MSWSLMGVKGLKTILKDTFVRQSWFTSFFFHSFYHMICKLPLKITFQLISLVYRRIFEYIYCSSHNLIYSYWLIQLKHLIFHLVIISRLSEPWSFCSYNLGQLVFYSLTWSESCMVLHWCKDKPLLLGVL